MTTRRAAVTRCIESGECALADAEKGRATGRHRPAPWSPIANHSTFKPLMIGPRNAELVLGVPWRFAKDHARRLGVEIIRVGGKSLIPATPLIEALRAADRTRPTPIADELDAMRARLRKGA